MEPAATPIEVVKDAAHFRAEQVEEIKRAEWKWPVDPDLYVTLGNGSVRRRHRKLTRAEQKAASRSKVRPAKDRRLPDGL